MSGSGSGSGGGAGAGAGVGTSTGVGAGSSGGSGNSSGSPCGACKFLRRKCVQGCIFAPYFDSEQGASHFAAVHKVFGASNVSKLLLSIPVNRRLDTVITVCYEAQSRLRDPVYGCVGHIFALQQQVMSLQAELSYLQGHLNAMELPQPPPPPPPPQAPMAPPFLSFSDLPPAATAAMPIPYDLATLFEPMAQTSWAIQQRSMDQRQYLSAGPSSTTSGSLQAVARELSNRHGSSSTLPMPSSNASSSLSLSK